MKKKALIDSALRTTTWIDQIVAEYNTAEKGRTRGFNFFFGLAADGTHWEWYHSNFIRYLLSPKDHEFDRLFLRHFLEMLKAPQSGKLDDNKLKRIDSFLLQLDTMNVIDVLREQPTFNGKVDIEIIFRGLDGILFIENKVRSREGPNQMSDYFEHYFTFHKNCCLGVYLTKDGHSPPSINADSQYAKSLITISYKDIILWLETCCQDKEIAEYPRVEGCLYQYITVVKRELNIMPIEEQNQMVAYLMNNVKDLRLLAKDQQMLNDAIVAAVQHCREAFLLELLIQLKSALESKEYEFHELKAGHLLCYLSGKPSFWVYIEQAYPDTNEGGKGLWWGVYTLSENPYRSCFELSSDYWEPILIDGINDFKDDNEGSAKIIESTLNLEVRSKIITQITQYISNKIKTKVVSMLQ